MSRVFFATELEGVATFWRIMRRDGVTLGFTSHNRDLWFDGVLHRAAPGMLPSAIKRTADLSADSAEVQGVLSHGSIRADDLHSGRFDGSAVQIGAVDWETLDRSVLYHGNLGAVSEEDGSFTAELQSAKVQLAQDFIPRTSPTCRAQFCGPGCSLSSFAYTSEAVCIGVNRDRNAVIFSSLDQPLFVGGELRWLDGPQAGLLINIVDETAVGLVLDTPISSELGVGTRAILKQGCDHSFATCQSRFRNAINFQGEPFLPGNDLLSRYPLPQ